MGALETVTAFNDAMNAQRWEDAARYLTDDFAVAGLTPQPLGKQGFIAGQQAWAAAAPDWHVTLENLRMEGDTVLANPRFTGTHTGTLALPGQPPVPATGRHFESQGASSATLRGDQLASLTVTPGSPGILEQLGVPMPR